MNNKMRYRGLRKDNMGTIEGYYFVTPLTSNIDGIDAKDGLFFQSDMKTRHCISDEDGCVHEVYPDSVCCIQITELTNRIRQFKVVNEIIVKESLTDVPKVKAQARTEALNSIVNEMTRLGID